MTDNPYAWRTVEEWMDLAYDEGYKDGHYVGATDPEQWP